VERIGGKQSGKNESKGWHNQPFSKITILPSKQILTKIAPFGSASQLTAIRSTPGRILYPMGLTGGRADAPGHGTDCTCPRLGALPPDPPGGRAALPAESLAGGVTFLCCNPQIMGLLILILNSQNAATQPVREPI
jgi:hypothetical protein